MRILSTWPWQTMFLSIRSLLLVLIFLFAEMKGWCTPSFPIFSDSVHILSFRSYFGTDFYLEYSQLENALIEQSLFDKTENFFVAIGFSVGFKLPNSLNVSPGIYLSTYFAQNQYLNTDSTSRTFRLNGISYGLYAEKPVRINQKIQFHLGLRFLRNRMNLSIYENTGFNDPRLAFNNSRGLEIEYKSNTLNPYALFEYQVISRKSHDFSIGISLDYKYILPTSPWKLSKSDVYDQWTYKGSTTTVDLPFFGNSVIGSGLFFTIRTYL